MNLVSAKLQSSGFAFAISSSVMWSPSYSVPSLSTSSVRVSHGFPCFGVPGQDPPPRFRQDRAIHSRRRWRERVQFCRSLRRTDVDKAWMPKTRSTNNFSGNCDFGSSRFIFQGVKPAMPGPNGLPLSGRASQRLLQRRLCALSSSAGFNFLAPWCTVTM